MKPVDLTVESDVVAAILKHYEKHPTVTIWRQNTGAKSRGGRLIRFGKVGAGDLTGLIAPDGRRLEIECKKKGNKTDPDRVLAQQKYADMIRSNGGVYVLAYSLDDVRRAMGEVE